MLKNCHHLKESKVRVIDKMEQNSHMHHHPNSVTIVNFMNTISKLVSTK